MDSVVLYRYVSYMDTSVVFTSRVSYKPGQRLLKPDGVFLEGVMNGKV